MDMAGPTALGQEICCEASSHNVQAVSPNFCLTPAPPAPPIPVPYVIAVTTATCNPKTENTFIEDKGVLNAKGKVPSMKGNEPGTVKDITTFQTNGAAWALPIMVVILFEGAPVAVTGNPGFGNSIP
jgi:hypothetical protein